MSTKNTDILMQNKAFGWVAAFTGLILMIPLVAMQFTSDVDWSSSDFVIMGILLFGMGSMFVMASRFLKTNTKRVVVGLAFLFALLYVWAELAVGIFTNWGS